MSRVLVIGAYGMIGSAITRHLLSEGHEVTGMGRDIRAARRAFPGLDWQFRDLAHMTLPADWVPLLRDVDAVVNAAGALQDGPGDDLAAIHADAIAALAGACAEVDVALIQISAAGVSPDAPTAFFRTKAAGDAAIAAAGGRYWILRPGLVLSDTAYGGTGLLRMLCAVPLVQPIAAPEAQVQTIGIADLCAAVSACLGGEVAGNVSADLVEPAPHPLRGLVAELRGWLGFAPARWTITAPGWALMLAGRLADGLGRLGWRSPLRSTAIATLADGVTGDPGAWDVLGGPRVRGLTDTLAAMPARSEDRLAARIRLLMPFVVATLAAFWAMSGLIGLARLGSAAEVLTNEGWPRWLAGLSVAFWAVADLVLAGALLWRRWAVRACLGMVAVSVIYLVSATLFVPSLWGDPLGPLVKVLPGAMLALVALPMLESR